MRITKALSPAFVTAFALVAATLLAVALMACTTPKQPPIPLGNLKLGTAYFTQPAGTADLLAGYMTEDLPKVDEGVLRGMDTLFNDVLRAESKHVYVGQDMAMSCTRSLTNEEWERQAALRKWSAVGRCMGVDLILVPQLLEWRERDGSAVGVVTAAKVVMDTYVVDVRNESLISRSRYDETQSALTSNLLDTGKFLKRGGKWVEARELAREGMEKAVKELGL